MQFVIIVSSESQKKFLNRLLLTAPSLITQYDNALLNDALET